MYWLKDERLSKQVLFGEVATGKRPIGRPKLRFKAPSKRVWNTATSTSISKASQPKELDGKKQSAMVSTGRGKAWRSRAVVPQRQIPNRAAPTGFICPSCQRSCKGRVGPWLTCEWRVIIQHERTRSRLPTFTTRELNNSMRFSIDFSQCSKLH